MKRDLTDAWIRTVQPPEEGRLEIRDARVPGLVLRFTKKGAKAGKGTWSVRLRTHDGKHTRPKVGTWPALGIADARKQARAIIGAIEKGSDPAAEKREARAARKRQATEQKAAVAGTVAARLLEWQAGRAGDRVSPWSERYSAEVQRVCDQAVIPALGARPLAETTREDWTGLIRDWKRTVAKPKAKPKAGEKGRAGAPARDGSGAAAFLYRTASAFLNYAEAHGWIAAPLLPRKGASIIAAPPASRERVLSDDELLAVWNAADREPPKQRAAIRLLILTAAREGEVADLSVGEIDLPAARWTIPAERAKNRTALTVPLSPLAMAELAVVIPEDAEAETYLFGRSGTGGFTGWGKLKKRIDAASKVTGWRWHDLRRTARTGMTRLGVPRDHAEAAINHISGRSKLDRTYDRHDYADEVIAALTRWQAHVAGLVGQGAEIVMLESWRPNAG